MRAAKQRDPFVQLSVQFENAVNDVGETLSNVCRIARVEGAEGHAQQ